MSPQDNAILKTEIRLMTQSKAREMGVNLTSIAFRDIKTLALAVTSQRERFGYIYFCAFHIRFKHSLVKYPLLVIKYVIIHELAHYFYKSHGVRFWDIVERFMPNYQEVRGKAFKIDGRLVRFRD